MKTNIDYYPRKKNWSKHPKIKMLKIKYGEAGDSKFGTLCDYIADAKYCWLDLSEPYIKTDVADALKFNFEELDEFVSFLENECKLIIRDENKISTNVAQEALSMVMKDRESAKSRRNKPRQSLEQLEKSPEQIKESVDVLPTETTNKTKLNKIKVNESKEEESKEEISPHMIFYVGEEKISSVKKFLNDNFQILMTDLKIKYGEGIFYDAMEEFERNNIEKNWKDLQDIRSHFTNFLRVKEKEKSSGKKEKESHVAKRQDENERIKQLNAQKYGT